MSLPLCHSLTSYSLLETMFGCLKAIDGDHVSANSYYTLEERWYQPSGTDGVESIRRSSVSPVFRVDRGVPDTCASRRPPRGAELAPSLHERQAVIHAGSIGISETLVPSNNRGPPRNRCRPLKCLTSASSLCIPSGKPALTE